VELELGALKEWSRRPDFMCGGDESTRFRRRRRAREERGGAL
jgi:hypothetical protein